MLHNNNYPAVPSLLYPGSSMMTDEQKEHAKQAARKQSEIRLTHQAFFMYLQNGESAAVAIEKAQEAVSVWMNYEDANWIDAPEISPEQIREAQQKIQESMRQPPIPPEWFDQFSDAIRNASLAAQGMKKMTKKQIAEMLLAQGGESGKRRRVSSS